MEPQQPVYAEGSSAPATFYPTHFLTGLNIVRKRSGPNGLVVSGDIEEVKRLVTTLYISSEALKRSTYRLISSIFVAFARSRSTSPDRWLLNTLPSVSFYADLRTDRIIIDATMCPFMAAHLRAHGYEGTNSAFETRRASHISGA